MTPKRKRKKPGPPPGKGRDPIRTIRVPDHEWDRWLELTHSRGTTVAKTVRSLMVRWSDRVTK